MDKMIGLDYENSIDSVLRKKNGTFYTPSSIIDKVLKRALGDVDVLDNPFVRILDPSCGCGYFLLGVYKVLYNAFYKRLSDLRKKFNSSTYKVVRNQKTCEIYGYDYWNIKNLSYHIIQNCIYGADIDAEAVKIAKENLIKVSGNKNLQQINIVCCNSLVRWEKNSSKDELSIFWGRKYNYVVGNPPWVSLSRKFGNNADEKLLEYYMNEYHGNRYLPNLYEYFIKRSIEVLEKKGKLGFVIPDRFAKNLYYRDFRKEILENYNIVYVAFGIEFPGINTDCMIFIMQKKFNLKNGVVVEEGKDSCIVKQESYMRSLNMCFYGIVYIKFCDIKYKIESQSVFLGDMATTFTGFIGKSSIISEKRLSTCQTCILRGKSIEKYAVVKKFYYEFKEENIKGGTRDIKKLKFKKKIIMRKTGKDIIAAIDYSGCIIEQSLYGIICDDNFEAEYVLGILNSKLIKWYYRNFLVTNCKSMPQIKKYILERIPVKKCTKSLQKKISRTVSCISSCESQDMKIALENELDDMIFSLYKIEGQNRQKILDMVNK